MQLGRDLFSYSFGDRFHYGNIRQIIAVLDLLWLWLGLYILLLQTFIPSLELLSNVRHSKGRSGVAILIRLLHMLDR